MQNGGQIPLKSEDEEEEEEKKKNKPAPRENLKNV